MTAQIFNLAEERNKRKPARRSKSYAALLQEAFKQHEAEGMVAKKSTG
jgi:hypothetical protein